MDRNVRIGSSPISGTFGLYFMYEPIFIEDDRPIISANTPLFYSLAYPSTKRVIRRGGERQNSTHANLHIDPGNNLYPANSGVRT